MEQAAAGALESLLPQLGIAGLVVLLGMAFLFLWLKESRAVRGDTETAIARKQRDLERKDREIERLDGQIAEKDARIRELEKVNREQHEEIMSLRYPGVHVQVEAPLEHEEP